MLSLNPNKHLPQSEKICPTLKLMYMKKFYKAAADECLSDKVNYRPFLSPRNNFAENLSVGKHLYSPYGQVSIYVEFTWVLFKGPNGHWVTHTLFKSRNTQKRAPNSFYGGLGEGGGANNSKMDMKPLRETEWVTYIHTYWYLALHPMQKWLER